MHLDGAKAGGLRRECGINTHLWEPGRENFFYLVAARGQRKTKDGFVAMCQNVLILLLLSVLSS